MKDTLRRMYLVPGCLALGWLLFAASALRGDLLLNGSFESPEVPETDSFLIFGPGESIGEGWVSEGFSLVYPNRTSDFPLPLDGVQALGLAGAAVYQDVVLPESTSFRLTFQLASDDQFASLVEIDVLRNGVSLFQYPHEYSPTPGAGFEPIAFALEFQSSTTDIYRIRVDSGGAYVDAFSLTEVPESGTAVLWSLMGLVTMAWSCRARRNRMPPRPW